MWQATGTQFLQAEFAGVACPSPTVAAGFMSCTLLSQRALNVPASQWEMVKVHLVTKSGTTEVKKMAVRGQK
jgi:hypothetical protein